MSDELRKALAASLAKRSVATMDPPYTAAFNAALDMVERDVAPFLAVPANQAGELARIAVAKALARHPDSSWDDYEWEDMASFVRERFLEQADLAIAAHACPQVQQ